MRIRVEFEVPDDIAAGLENRTFKRFGGVIRRADSGQVAAMLHEGGSMSPNVSSSLNLLPSMLRATGMNARTIAVVAGAVTVAGPLLDIAITAYTIHHLTRRIEALKKKIEAIYDRVDRRFDRAEAAALQTALQLANELLETENTEARREKAHDVVARLVNAEKLLLMDLDDALDSNRRRRAEVLVNAVTSVNMLVACCSFEVGDDKIAISRLETSLGDLRPRVERLVLRLIGRQPAVYFHKSVSDNYLDRYIQIQAWLYGDEDVWERVIKKARRRFWSEKTIRRLFRTARRFLYTWPKLRKKPFYRNAIPRAELLIESFQRFESYAFDPQASCRFGRHLESQSEEAAKRLADYTDLVLVIDEDALDGVERLSA